MNKRGAEKKVATKTRRFSGIKDKSNFMRSSVFIKLKRKHILKPNPNLPVCFDTTVYNSAAARASSVSSPSAAGGKSEKKSE